MGDAAQCRIAVGSFDGVHIGHRELLKGVEIAVTFGIHPKAVVHPEIAPKLICSVEERVQLLKGIGVSEVKVLEFTPELASLSAEDFLKMLEDFTRGRRMAIRCSNDWHFGKGGVGNVELLKRLGAPYELVPTKNYRGERVSSSRIRRSLAEGDMALANAMLGREYAVRGKAFRGKRMGTGMGFPTINLNPGRPLNLKEGVYKVEVEGVAGVANYGFAPTMGEKAWKEQVLEVHLLGDEVGRIAEADELTVKFLRFLREERKFASVEELKNQIAEDRKQALAKD